MNRQRGFTMIELVVTMIIVGILALTVLPRFDALGGFDAAGYADQTKSLIRYAQKTAIAQRRWVAIDVGASLPTICSMTYSVYPTCSATCSGGTSVALPGGAPSVPQASTTFDSGSSTVLCFDAVGRPFANGASTALAVAATLTIKDGNDPFRTITVEAETGYVR